MLRLHQKSNDNKKTNKSNILTTKTKHNRHNQGKRVNQIADKITRFH